VWVPPAGHPSRAARMGPLCPCPHFTPPHPICCPKSQTGIKRSAKPSTGRWLQKNPRLTLKTAAACTEIADNLHAWRNVCLFAWPPAPSRSPSPGAVPGPGHTSRTLPSPRGNMRRRQRLRRAPRKHLCLLPSPRLPAPTSISNAAVRGRPAAHPRLQVAIRVQKGLRKDILTSFYQFFRASVL